ncbi:hypothetical protein HYE82_25920 [Streptomyces sp. BR123]|uniref:hypothetical protein n=1 Tax=Streptomyces sp. BR123 TaxID=2749828 RepID=UPI0015C47F3E|nr:hypothetical protein [Streptomyces sp. BR123]NXY97751.1 hypothetical protein [Streptomyces sp. BR123]
MTGVELVVAALAAGASAGLTDTASSAVRDAYGALREAVRHRLSARGVEVLDDEEAEPDVREARLREELTASGVDRDRELLAAAENLWVLVRPGSTYQVDARGAKGVQVGDHSTQTNTFH